MWLKRKHTFFRCKAPTPPHPTPPPPHPYSAYTYPPSPPPPPPPVLRARLWEWSLAVETGWCSTHHNCFWISWIGPSAARMAWSLLTLAEMDVQSHPIVLRKQSVGECFGQRDKLFLWGDGNYWIAGEVLGWHLLHFPFSSSRETDNAVCDSWPSGALGTA